MNIPLNASLHHLTLASLSPQRLAQFYADALDMTMERNDDAWVCRGTDRRLVFVEGTAKTLVSAGYQVASLDVLKGLRRRLTDRGVALDTAPTPMFPADALTFRDPDGHRISYGVPRRDAGTRSRMPARLQHLVVGSRNAERMVEFYTNVVGLRESDRVNDAGQLRTSFMRTANEHHSFAVFQTSEDRLDHHCYEVDDWNRIRDWGDRFAALRAPIKWGPGRHGPGNNLFMFIHDLDGNWIELSAELQIVPDDKPVGLWPHEEYTLNSWGQALLRS